MGKTPKASRGGTPELLAQLDALRADCRRHPEIPVELHWVEGDGDSLFELAVEKGLFKPITQSLHRSPRLRVYLGAEGFVPHEVRARGFLERLGALASAHPELRSMIGGTLLEPGVRESDFMLGASMIRDTAPRKDVEDRPCPWEKVPPKVRCEWIVPDVLAAIARRADAVLASSRGRKKRAETKEERVLRAVAYISKHPDATDQAVADELGITKSTYSRTYSEHPMITGARLSNKSDRRVSRAEGADYRSSMR